MRVGPLAALLVLAGCSGSDLPTTSAVVPGGNPRLGHRAIVAYGCGACHVIPGVRGATGVVGPPLTAYGRRVFVAGHLPNRPDDLARWIMDPPSVSPRTAMPNLGVPEATARDIAAYLHTLR